MSKTTALRRLKRLYWKSRIAENMKTSLNRVRQDIAGAKESDKAARGESPAERKGR